MTSKVRPDARMRKPILEELFSAESMVSYRLRSRLTSPHSRNKGLSRKERAKPKGKHLYICRKALALLKFSTGNFFIWTQLVYGQIEH